VVARSSLASSLFRHRCSWRYLLNLTHRSYWDLAGQTGSAVNALKLNAGFFVYQRYASPRTMAVVASRTVPVTVPRLVWAYAVPANTRKVAANVPFTSVLRNSPAQGDPQHCRPLWTVLLFITIGILRRPPSPAHTASQPGDSVGTMPNATPVLNLRWYSSLLAPFGNIVPGVFTPVLAKHSNPNRSHWQDGRRLVQSGAQSAGIGHAGQMWCCGRRRQITPRQVGMATVI